MSAPAQSPVGELLSPTGPTAVGPDGSGLVSEATRSLRSGNMPIVETPSKLDDNCPPLPLGRALVIDSGSHTTRAGFGGDPAPCSELLSLVGRRKHYGVCYLGPGRKDCFVGPEIHEQSEAILSVRAPIQGDHVESWDDVERLWKYIFTKELDAKPEEHAILMTAPLGRSRRDKEILAMIVFETFSCPAFFSSDSAPLALYATGRTTGLVVDSGHCRTAVVPVYEGHPLMNAVQTFDVTGKDITTYLRPMLAENSALITDQTEELVIQNIKEQLCHVTLDPYIDLINKDWNEKSYILPDGQALTVGDECFRAPEPMFSPFLGLHTAIIRAIKRSDTQVRKDLFRCIILSGGNTLFPGFANRLQQDLDATITPGTTVSVMTPLDAKNIAWLGGSMLSSLSTFHSMCIRNEEYDEYGPVMLQRKCFGINP